MLLYGMAYAGLVGLVLALLGRDIFLLWFGGSIHANLKLTFSLGLYFILLSWENIHFTILIGAKDIWRPSILYLVRSLLSVGVMSVMIRNVGESGPFWALCGSTILVTIIPFTYLVRRYLSDKVAYGAAN
jgi:O-antigen/teichoic acid export membrane protein